jgi:hypothetical protein
MYRAPQTEIVCKSYAPGKLTYQLPPLRPANLLDFHLLGLGFWILLMLNNPLEPHCKDHLLLNAISGHISSQRYPATILASLSLCFFTVFVHFHSLIENCVLLYLCVYGCISNTFMLYYWIFEISRCIDLLYLCSHFMPKIIWITPELVNPLKYFELETEKISKFFRVSFSS